jgi:hypothetical protein
MARCSISVLHVAALAKGGIVSTCTATQSYRSIPLHTLGSSRRFSRSSHASSTLDAGLLARLHRRVRDDLEDARLPVLHVAPPVEPDDVLARVADRLLDIFDQDAAQPKPAACSATRVEQATEARFGPAIR